MAAFSSAYLHLKGSMRPSVRVSPFSRRISGLAYVDGETIVLSHIK